MKNKMKCSIFIVLTLLLFSLTNAASINVKPTAPPVAGGNDTALSILGIAQWVGFIVGIGMVIFAGYKYITAGAGAKADVKSTMIPLLIGAFLVALAPQIAEWVFNLFSSNGGTP